MSAISITKQSAWICFTACVVVTSDTMSSTLEFQRDSVVAGELRVSLFSPYFRHNPTELRQKKVNQRRKKSAVLKGDRTQDPSVMVQCATDYATAASSLDSLLLYLINVTNEISCI